MRVELEMAVGVDAEHLVPRLDHQSLDLKEEQGRYERGSWMLALGIEQEVVDDGPWFWSY